MREPVFAIYSVLRGFLNAMNALEENPRIDMGKMKSANGEDDSEQESIADCAKLFFCEGAAEAAKRGHIGQVVAKVSR